MLKNFQEYFNTIQQHTLNADACLGATNFSEAKKGFLKNPDLRAPIFRYDRPEQSPEYVKNALQSLDRIKHDILRDRQLDADEKRVLNQHIRYAQGQANFVLTAHEYRNSYSESRKNACAISFACYNKSNYGEPNRALALRLLDREVSQLHAKVPKFTESEIKVYGRLSVNLPAREEFQKAQQSNDPGTSLFVPSASTIAEFGKAFRKFFTLYFSDLPSRKAILTPEEVADFIRDKIELLQCWSGTTYQVRISDTESNFKLDQRNRILYVPRYRALGPYTRSVLEVQFCADVLVRLFRGVPYENCGLSTLATGYLDHEEFEEGLVSACRFVTHGGEFVPQGTNHYVNIGLLHHFSKEGYDFRKVFEIRRDLLYLSTVMPLSSENEKISCFQKAEDKAFAELNFSTHGTGILPFEKGLTRFTGGQKVWEYIESVFDTEDDNEITQLFEDFFWSGVIDPLKQEHLKTANFAMKGKYGSCRRVPWVDPWEN